MKKINTDENRRHRVIFAECDYPPELIDYFGHIDMINSELDLANSANGFNPLQPHRITRPERNGKRNMRKSRWQEAVDGTGPGYHVAEKYLQPYISFFRKYLKHNDPQ